MLKSRDVNAEVKIVYQTVENLHLACPDHLGDWYFTGDYPTPGGNKVVSNSFINYIKGKNQRAYYSLTSSAMVFPDPVDQPLYLVLALGYIAGDMPFYFLFVEIVGGDQDGGFLHFPERGINYCSKSFQGRGKIHISIDQRGYVFAKSPHTL